MSIELYKEFRPSKLSEVVGQDAAVEQLLGFIEDKSVPHAMLYHGPSGCGKTTLARIMKEELGCGDADFTEMNSADFTGIESIRKIRSRMNLSPISGPCRIWLIDECHMLSTAAQEAMLKMLEDTPRKVYFMLCTTDPQKLKKAIQTRCTPIRVKELSKSDLIKSMLQVCKAAGFKISKEVLSKIAEYSEGSARKALVFLDQVRRMEDEDAMMETISSNSLEVEAIALARALLNPKVKFNKIAPMLKAITDEPESIRRMILGYASAVMMNGGKVDRCYLLIEAFRGNFYDSGKAGLCAACYEVSTAE